MFLITIIFTDSDVWEMRPELRGANVSGRAVIGVTLVQSVWCKLNELNHPIQTGTFVYSSLLFNTEFNLLSLLVRALLTPLISDRCLEADMRQSICQRRASCHNITVIMFSVCLWCVLHVCVTGVTAEDVGRFEPDGSVWAAQSSGWRSERNQSAEGQ